MFFQIYCIFLEQKLYQEDIIITLDMFLLAGKL